KWERLLALRGAVNKALELARAEKTVGKPLDAEVTLFITDDAQKKYADALTYKLAELLIVSDVKIVVVSADAAGETDAVDIGIPGITAAVRASDAPMCARCWTHDARVGENSAHPELCPRCAETVG
ncbi:MAG: isoleucine--tRNA ligase, partial [Oscillospiraceae bacterium]|nr:isoleucine--tRNA ligase [Oscillospiraceae bacterium]